MKKSMARLVCESIYRHAMNHEKAVVEALIADWIHEDRMEGHVRLIQYADHSIIRIHPFDEYFQCAWQNNNASNIHKMPILFK